MELLEDLNWGDDPGAPTSTVQSDAGYTPPYTEVGRDNPMSSGTSTTSTPSSSVAVSRGATVERVEASNRITGGDFSIPDDPQAVHESEMERVRTLATGLNELGLPIKYGSNALAV